MSIPRSIQGRDERKGLADELPARRRGVASVLASNRMEGFTPSEAARNTMNAFAEGTITRKQMQEDLRQHALRLK